MGRLVSRIGVVLIISAGLVIMLFLGYYLTGERFAEKNTVVFEKERLKLVAGQGDGQAGGVEIRQLSEQGFALVISAPSKLPAAFFSEFVWDMTGLQEGTAVNFAWVTAARPNAVHETPLAHFGLNQGKVSLAGIREWQGVIAGIGLRVLGPLPEPITLHKLILQPAAPDPRLLLTSLWREWTSFEGWKNYTINVVPGTPRNALFPPVLAAAAWIVLAGLLYIVIAGWRGWPRSILPFVLIFMIAWLVLDARWQLELWRQLNITYERFAGKNWQEKRLADRDGKLFRFISEIRSKLPELPTRIFLVNAEPGGATFYRRGRAHYHLLPHNVYSSLKRLPTRKMARKGDYILILKPFNNLIYDANRQLLRWGKRSLPVEPVFSAAMGDLFKVRK